MKKEITNKKTKDKFLEEMKQLCHKYNAFPMAELDTTTRTIQHKLYELDKLTWQEKSGL